MTLTEWASVISAAGSIATGLGVAVLILQIVTDHERSRRDRAIQLMGEYTRTISNKSTSSAKLAEELDDNQCRSLLNHEPIKIRSSLKRHLEVAVGKTVGDDRIKDDEVSLNMEETLSIRWEVVNYLNVLETTLSAWRHNVVDRLIIEEQFLYLLDPARGKKFLRTMREAAGGSRSYPSLAEFDLFLQELQSRVRPGRRPLWKMIFFRSK